MTYSEKLQDPRWKALRRQVLERDEFTCRDCHNDDNPDERLHVHHCFYFKGDPWDTPSEYLVTVCPDCHRIRQDLEDTIKQSIGRIFAQSSRLEISSLIFGYSEEVGPLGILEIRPIGDWLDVIEKHQIMLRHMVRLTEDGRYLELRPSEHPHELMSYEIRLSELLKPESLLGWISHLCDKEWITKDHISRIISLVAELRNWRIR